MSIVRKTRKKVQKKARLKGAALFNRFNALVQPQDFARTSIL